MPNLVKIGQMRPRYYDFSIFQAGGGRHLGFSKFQIFNGRTAEQGRTVSESILIKFGTSIPWADVVIYIVSQKRVPP